MGIIKGNSDLQHLKKTYGLKRLLIKIRSEKRKIYIFPVVQKVIVPKRIMKVVNIA